VFTYYDATFSRGGKSVVINYNMIFAIKDGKVVEEWDIYDSAPIMNLLK
jgi:predicted ester cyclase